MSAPECTLHEMLTVTLAREIRDGEVGFTGLATGGPAALYAAAIPQARRRAGFPSAVRAVNGSRVISCILAATFSRHSTNPTLSRNA